MNQPHIDQLAVSAGNDITLQIKDVREEQTQRHCWWWTRESNMIQGVGTRDELSQEGDQAL